MKEVKGVGFIFPSNNNDDYIRIDSFGSLSDADIVVFCPDLFNTEYTDQDQFSISTVKHQGKKLFNSESSSKIKEHVKHWNKELHNFVLNGGTLFTILCRKQDYFIYSGAKKITGSGKGQRIKLNVEPFSNYDFLPFSNYDYLPFEKFEFHSSLGKKVYSKSPIFNDLITQFGDSFSYEVYMKAGYSYNAAFGTKKGDRDLGAYVRLKGGIIILLPNLDWDEEKYLEEDERTGEFFYSEEGKKRSKIFINCLVQIDRALRKKQIKSPKPSWVKHQKFELKEAIITKSLIEENNREIKLKTEQNQELAIVLEEHESLKNLLFETGKPLEDAVTKALKILEYKAENYDDGELELDQIITSPEGDRFIGECEGKDKKAIDVSKFRQLLDGLNADFEREEIEEKAYGLLFGNPQRLVEPNERDLDFTQKCKKGANREDIGLILTTDLFNICRYISESGDSKFAESCRKAIKNQLGELVKFPKPKSK